MIDIEKELTAIVERLAIPWEERDGELMEALIALCTRYGNEKLEDAANLAQMMAMGETTGTGGQKAINIAAAIRATKEGEG